MDDNKSKIDKLFEDERKNTIYLLTIDISEDEDENDKKTYTVLEDPTLIYGWIEYDDDLRNALDDNDEFETELYSIFDIQGYGVYIVKILFEVEMDYDDYRQWSYLVYSECAVDFYYGTRKEWDERNLLVFDDDDIFFNLPL